MRHKGKIKDEISSEPIEGESNHIEAISILCPSMPTINVSSKSIFRGELMSISLVEDLNYHEKESAPPETKDFINEHGSYFQTIPSNPRLYEKSPKLIYNSTITSKSYNPFLLPIHKILEKVVVDAFVYHKLCKFHGVVA